MRELSLVRIWKESRIKKLKLSTLDIHINSKVPSSTYNQKMETCISLQSQLKGSVHEKQTCFVDIEGFLNIFKVVKKVCLIEEKCCKMLSAVYSPNK